MKSLLGSRKFWLAVFAIVQALVLHYLSVPDDVWQAIVGVVMLLIGGIAVEDAALKVGVNRESKIENRESKGEG